MTAIQEIKARRWTHVAGDALAEAVSYPLKVYRHRYLVANAFRRELFGRFKGSLLGVGWVLIHPVFLFITYYLVFGLLFNMRGKPGAPASWYSFYLFSGILIWMLFSETTLRSCSIVVDNGNLIQKVAFPSELLPLPLVLVNLVVLGVGLFVIYAGSAVWALVDSSTLAITWPGPEFLLIFPLAFEVALFALGVGLFLAAAHVFLRDTLQIYTVILLFWFFVSPIFWYSDFVSRGGGADFLRRMQGFIQANPFYSYTLGIRGALGISDRPWSDALSGVEGGLLPALAAFLLGCFFFNLLKRRFADEV